MKDFPTSCLNLANFVSKMSNDNCKAVLQKYTVITYTSAGYKEADVWLTQIKRLSVETLTGIYLSNNYNCKSLNYVIIEFRA